MALTAQAVLDRARVLLIDTTATRWSDAELLRWVGDAQRVIVGIKPNACSAVVVVDLVQGTRQTLPADAFTFMGASRNMIDASTPGRAVRVVQRDVFDRQRPDWHTEGKVKTVQNYMFDPTDQTFFYVYPPNDGTGKLEINYAKQAAEPASGATALAVLDAYLPAVVDYVCYRAYVKDGETAGNFGLAQHYLTSFAQFLGLAGQGEDSVSPNLMLGPIDPQAKGSAR